MKVPKIALISSKRQVTSVGGGTQFLYGINTIFVDILIKLGALPTILPPLGIKDLGDRPNDLIMEYCDLYDGLMLLSGPDINPEMYNQAKLIDYTSISAPGIPFVRPYGNLSSLEQDQFECYMARSFFERDKPILGICRGMQMINVALGGTLSQEIPDSKIKHELHEDFWIPYHDLIIKEESKLYKLMGVDSYTVSSLHHQAIKDLGQGLIVSAFAPDGICEAIEAENKKFVLGIQGHPEKIIDNYVLYNNVFQAFVNAMREV